MSSPYFPIYYEPDGSATLPPDTAVVAEPANVARAGDP
jgi:hypothetical protein